MATAKLQLLVDLEDRVSGEMQKVQSSLEKFKGSVEKLEPAFKKMAAIGTAGFVAITGAVAASVAAYSEAGSALMDMSTRTGFSVKSLSELSYAAKMSGASVETLEAATKSMSKFMEGSKDSAKAAALAYQKNLSAAADSVAEKSKKLNKELAETEVKLKAADSAAGSRNLKPYRDRIASIKEELAGLGKEARVAAPEADQFALTLQKIGLKVADLQGLAPEDSFMKLAAGVAGLTDPTQRAAVAMDIFGKAGTDLLPLFAEGPAGLAKLREEAGKLGVVMDQEAAAKAKAFADGMERLKTGLEGARNALAVAFLPMLTKAVEAMQPFLEKVIAWANANPELVRTITIVAASIFGLLAAIGALGLVLGPLAAGLSGIAAAIAFLASPIGIVILAVGALVAAGVYLVSNWEQHIDNLKWAWSGFKDFFLGIVDSIKAGFDAFVGWIAGKVKAVINSVKSALDAIASLPGVSSVVKASRSALSGIADLFRASGGPVSAGRPYIVGERGPEMFVPSASGSIVPNHALAFAGASAGPTFNITITGNTLLDRDAMRKIGGEFVRYLKDNVRV